LLIDSALSGDPLDLSPGEQILDLTHVDDIVSAFRIAAERQLASGEPLFDDFLVSGERVSIRELIFTVSEAIGRPVPARLGALPYRAREVMVPVCASGDRRLPGWTAKRRLAEALPGLVPDGASC
jgi:nucleoside-diphosphate-sugar epimerase